MAGERQHFLPRFLLKGFASRSKGDGIYSWVFRRDRPPYETNIINIGVASKFYSVGGNNDLDNLITDMENTFAACIDDLRSQTSGGELRNPKIPQFVTHLLTRTKYLRDSFYRSADYFFEVLLSKFDRPEVLEQVILNHIKTHPEQLWKNIQKSFKGHHLNRHQKAALMDSILKLAPALLRQQYPQMMTFVDSVKQYFRENLLRLVKESHIKALSKNPLPEARVDFARELNWFLVVGGQGSFVFGDVGVVSKIGSEGRLKPLPDLSDEVQQIWLPVSDTHLVMGYKKRELAKLDIEEINMGTSSLSHEFFISSRNSEQEKKLAEVLGMKSGILPEDDLERIVAELLSELKG